MDHDDCRLDCHEAPYDGCWGDWSCWDGGHYGYGYGSTDEGETSCSGGATCYGNDCDFWQSHGYTCNILESQAGCDCGGCECQDETSCSGGATCYGNDCDWWHDNYGESDGYTCDMMESYGCDCSGCDCDDAHCSSYEFEEGGGLCQGGEILMDVCFQYDGDGGCAATCAQAQNLVQQGGGDGMSCDDGWAQASASGCCDEFTSNCPASCDVGGGSLWTCDQIEVFYGTDDTFCDYLGMYGLEDIGIGCDCSGCMCEGGQGAGADPYEECPMTCTGPDGVAFTCGKG